MYSHSRRGSGFGRGLTVGVLMVAAIGALAYAYTTGALADVDVGQLLGGQTEEEVIERFMEAVEDRDEEAIRQLSTSTGRVSGRYLMDRMDQTQGHLAVLGVSAACDGKFPGRYVVTASFMSPRERLTVYYVVQTEEGKVSGVWDPQLTHPFPKSRCDISL